jgi:energy-coupling factor transporter ATP-binding protein EcfA2
MGAGSLVRRVRGGAGAVRRPPGHGRSAMDRKRWHPLRPLRNDGADETRYLPIDSSDQRYGEFTGRFDQSCGWAARGHLVVVTGERGYGKTSLIQRCACWLKKAAEHQGRVRVVVADLSDERWGKDEEKAARLTMTLSAMLDALGDNILEADRKAIESEAELWKKFRDLGRLLAATRRPGATLPPLVLVVLTQGYPKPDEIEQYYRFARPGMFFFSEVWERDHIAKVRRQIEEFDRDEVAAHELALNVLRTGDAHPLVQAIRSEGGAPPEVRPLMVATIDQNIIGAGSGVGVGQFSLLVRGILDIAAAEGAAEVTDAHLLRYFSQYLRDDAPGSGD